QVGYDYWRAGRLMRHDAYYN
ncbi:hypothetical protein A2U01_0103979, partial [Trifolium medium]|nr:hypothetical protein [Trifolium medium]